MQNTMLIPASIGRGFLGWRAVRATLVSSRPRFGGWIPRLLGALEHQALRSPLLQRSLVDSHARAFRRLLADLPRGARIGIVGGGLFPRTALALNQLYPESRLVIIDSEPRHLAIARRRLRRPARFVQACFDAKRPETLPGEFDLLVIPLAFVGDREALYRQPPAARVLVHEWLWRPRGRSTRVSWWLLKRLNLISRN